MQKDPKLKRKIKEKRKHAKEGLSLYKQAVKYAGVHKHLLFLALFFMVVGNILDLLVPIYIGKSIDCIIGVGNVNTPKLVENILILAGIGIINLLFTWLYNLYANMFCYKTSETIREKFFAKIESVPIKFVDSTTHGDLLNRMINDVEIMTDGMVEAIISVSSGIFTIVGTLICMLLLNVSIAIVIAVLTPLSLIASYIIAKKANVLFTEQAKTTGDMSGYLEELIGSQRVVKAFNHEVQSIESYDKINDKLTVVSEKAKFYSFLAPPLTRFVNGLVYVAVGFFGALLALDGKISVGTISSFLSYSTSYGKPFDEISNEITELQASFASVRRIFEVLDEPEEVSDENNAELSFCDGTVSIEHVDFSYVPKVKLIQDFNLEVASGQKVAIVGPTGCGKTTFINLIMRFYDVTGGAIKVSGQDIRGVTRASLRNKFGMVLQESWLFSGTIKENIAYGKQNASMEEIIEASISCIRLSTMVNALETDRLPKRLLMSSIAQSSFCNFSFFCWSTPINNCSSCTKLQTDIPIPLILFMPLKFSLKHLIAVFAITLLIFVGTLNGHCFPNRSKLLSVIDKCKVFALPTECFFIL